MEKLISEKLIDVQNKIENLVCDQYGNPVDMALAFKLYKLESDLILKRLQPEKKFFNLDTKKKPQAYYPSNHKRFIKNI
jgi:hypothetical protein